MNNKEKSNLLDTLAKKVFYEMQNQVGDLTISEALTFNALLMARLIRMMSAVGSFPDFAPKDRQEMIRFANANLSALKEAIDMAMEDNNKGLKK